ncbi:hypothetical protein L9F63_024323 [Diploptera punctata]|uniref:Uncharacterized protein n=1 Tax=Diploptera punctata TaxID=6984 RepID=A0AAD7ZHG1_DIPPU|nr:hypothetical protein L9F63_024323 [Diploptera punctata]
MNEEMNENEKNLQPAESSSSTLSSNLEEQVNTSERKLQTFPINNSAHFVSMKQLDYSLVHISVWGQLYRGIKCNICGAEALNTKLNERSGFSYKIIIKCTSCNNLDNEIY